MILQWDLHTTTDDRYLSLMQQAADAAVQEEGIRKKTAVHIILTDDDEIHEINRTYRGVDRATDVLSFPLVSYPEGKTAGQAQSCLSEAYDDEVDAVMLGDLVISMPHVLSQAQEYGHSPEREAAYLLVHGICHLMGYDHIEDDDRRRMRAMEEKILESIGVTRDGVTDSMLLEKAREAMGYSYSPYSGFPVGAALLSQDGKIFTGCNIENASLGLTNCAERTAVFKAVSEGVKEFSTIAIASRGTAPWPCGACRQVLNEFAPDLRVLVTWDGNVDEATLPQLLPHSFGPKQLVDEAGAGRPGKPEESEK
ncbi:MAG: rRNA maturation RNase YbeY [Clostridia bacterium]|nr:rRNA maturation RNase YbeY [Clostridia bacterium]